MKAHERLIRPFTAAAIAAALLAAVLAFAALSCGRGNLQVAHQADGLEIHQPEGLTAAPTTSAVTQLKELSCPEGVDSALWAELKDALKEALGKTAATPPTGDSNRVNDLAMADKGDGSYTLTWHYRNLGDYDQNGTVSISDITPLAQHYNETWAEGEEDTLAAVIDGSGNGKVGIEDVTPIAVNFQREVLRYVVEGAEAQSGPWEAVGEVQQNAGTGEGRLVYTSVISSPAALWHRVVPYDAEGNPGEASNAVLRPSNEPVIYEVSPNSGYQHEEYTFSATVTGAEPLTYAWDFGGAATPNTSSEVSPTVTLSDPGEYEANLTVINAYGSADYPFILTINERDMWAHTWGGSSYEEAEDVAVDGEGNIYILGYTESFGAGGQDAVVLKYSPEGELLWVKTWGGSGSEFPAGIAVVSDGRIVVGGHTSGLGAGADDIFILRYDPDGELLMQQTWGTPDYERVYDMAVDKEDCVYFGGVWLTFGDDNTDGLLVKLKTDGNLAWARKWDITRDDAAGAVAVDSAGRVYCGGSSGDDAAVQVDCVLLEFSPDGSLMSCWRGDTGINEGVGRIVPRNGDGLLLSGVVWDPRDMTVNPYILDFQSSQAVLVPVSSSLTDGPDATLWAAGKTVIESTSYAGVVRYDAALNVLRAWAWGEVGLSPTAYELTCDNTGNIIVAGYCTAATGAWREVTTAAESLDFEFTAVSLSCTELLGATNSIAGTESSPQGIEDTGGGGTDTLVIMNFPR